MATNIPGARLKGKTLAAAGNTPATKGPGFTVYGSVPPAGRVTVGAAVAVPETAVRVTGPAGNKSVYATSLAEDRFNVFDDPGTPAVTEVRLRPTSSAVRSVTSKPPSIDKNLSFSAGVPTLF